MRFTIAPLLIVPALMLAGCDKASSPAGQAPDKQATAPQSQAAGGDIELVAADGAKATLTHKFAGQPAPAAVFTGADGRDVTVTDFAGRPVLVNLWATWCAPCKLEMPVLDKLAVREEGKLTVLAVSQDLEGRKPVQAFFDSAKIANLEPYTDKGNALMSAFGNNIALPTTILYDADGKEIWRVLGGADWGSEKIAALLREAD